MTNYIRLPRSALCDELWRNKDLAALLCYLLVHADEKGEFQSSLTTIAAELRITPQQFKTLWKKLEGNQVATKLATKSPTKLATKFVLNIQADTTCRQPSKQRSNQPSKQPSSNQVKPTKFTPPTDEEVAAFVAEKGYHFNPAEFVPFYQTRGWKMKGGEPMKDWKAGCRYWETQWKQRHGEQFYNEIGQQLARPAFQNQNDRYSELERAAETVLRNAPYHDAP